MSDNLIRDQYLSTMGIEVWVSRDEVPTEHDSLEQKIVNNVVTPELEPSLDSNTERFDSETEIDINTLNWLELEEAVTQCHRCEYYKNRENTIFGSGNKEADLFIIGTVSNDAEDSGMREFVGAEGILLDNMLAAINLSRKDVYTSNLVKCKSPTQRQFSSVEIEKCIPYLFRQIELVKPKMLLLFGEQVAQFILNTNDDMAILTTNMHDYLNDDCLVVVIEHPEKLLASSANKKQAWLNLIKIKSVISANN